MTSYINAAEVYLTNAGVPINESDPLYVQAVKMLVSCWYDNRTVDTADKNTPQPYGLNGIILQLQLKQEEAADGS